MVSGFVVQTIQLVFIQIITAIRILFSYECTEIYL